MDQKIKYLENLRKKGYTESFTATSTSRILTDHKKLYGPEEIKITSFYTYSEDTDPQDYSVVYAIETNDGKKGILLDPHCKSPDDNVESFINSIKQARQNKKSWFSQPWQKMFKVKFSMNV
ncbi:MAG: hypothetical protein H0W61_01965 [Bacteroidetes bacterium]|nr:hypothetical protein [Bacteroidota bacterium]